MVDPIYYKGKFVPFLDGVRIVQRQAVCYRKR